MADGDMKAGTRTRTGYRLGLLDDCWLPPGHALPTQTDTSRSLISYVVQGTLQHHDSLGNTTRLEAGGLLVQHLRPRLRQQDRNASQRAPLHLIRLCLEGPDPPSPAYQAARFGPWPGQHLMLIGSPEGHSGTLRLHHNSHLYLARLTSDECLTLPLEGRRCGYLQVIDGDVELEEHQLGAGDGALIDGGHLPVWLNARGHAELLLVDLPVQ